MEQRRQDDERWRDHEKRISELETKVDSLWFHHRDDRMLERMNGAETAIEHLQSGAEFPKEKSGNGEVNRRLRWVEGAICVAIGAIAMFEFLVRIIK